MSDSIEDVKSALKNPIFLKFLHSPPEDPYWNVRGRPLKTLAGAKATGIGRLLTEQEQQCLDNTLLCFVPWQVHGNILWRYIDFE